MDRLWGQPIGQFQRLVRQSVDGRQQDYPAKFLAVSIDTQAEYTDAQPGRETDIPSGLELLQSLVSIFTQFLEDMDEAFIRAVMIVFKLPHGFHNQGREAINKDRPRGTRMS